MAVKAGKLRNLGEAIKANELYRRGDQAWSKGDLRPAFRLFLAAARAGMEAAFSTVGNFYDNGIGVKADPDAALDWYRLAYRSGDRSVANNIGCILRDRKKLGQAIGWFRRAVQQPRRCPLYFLKSPLCVLKIIYSHPNCSSRVCFHLSCFSL